jgi:hypothetical protein
LTEKSNNEELLKQTLRIDSSRILGPLDEKEAINGAGFVPNSVLTLVIYAQGSLIYMQI